MPDTQAFSRMRRTLAQAQGDALPVGELAAMLRGEHELLASLPPRYAEALEEILVRLESAGLFSEESCSFSRRDLFDALGAWLGQAQRAVASAKTG